MSAHFLFGKRIFILLHVVGWALILLLPLYFFNTEWAANTSFADRFYVSAFIYGLIFYLNYFLLVPKLFLNNKILAYLISVGIIILLLFYLDRLVIQSLFTHSPMEKEMGELFRAFNEKHNLEGPPFRGIQEYNFLFTSILISGFSLGLRVSEKFAQQEKMKEELVKVNLKTELAFLKNQVSPHFFFNTLNNIYSLMEIDVSDAQKAVLRLSKLMRYLLYESDQGKVSFSKELDFMKNYIALMSLRISSKVDLRLSFPEVDHDFQIPPLLFITFIENAFKHGVSYKEDCFIDIALKIDGDDLLFECSNSISPNQDQEEKIFAGIGLENIKKRLDLLFPGKSVLEISQEMRVFKVTLCINTHD
jgi:two-component sensor histidine kinase